MPTPLVTCHTSLGNTRTHTRQVFAELASVFPIYFAWGYGPTGDHKAGKALDVMAYADGTVDKPGPIRAGFNAAVATYLLHNRGRLGVHYLIHDRTILSSSPKSVTGVAPWAPKAYTGSDPHTNHVHVSFLETPPAYTPPAPEPAAVEEDMQPLTQLTFQPWLRQRWPDDKGLADGHLTVSTALTSGYAHSRAAREDVEALAAAVKKSDERTAATLAAILAKLEQLTGGGTA